MEFIQYVARPDVLGPLAGVLAILGWISISFAKRYFEHQEEREPETVRGNPYSAGDRRKEAG